MLWCLQPPTDWLSDHLVMWQGTNGERTPKCAKVFTSIQYPLLMWLTLAFFFFPFGHTVHLTACLSILIQFCSSPI